MSAEYAIAQYHRNPLRREPRNIGIIVAVGDSRAARFTGEIADTGEIDGRSTKWVAHPNVYRKWVKYWREQLAKPGDNLLHRLTQTNGDNYDVVRGGVVTDYGQDSAQAICDNLFSLLVAPEEVAPATAGREEAEWEISARELEGQVLGEFRNLGIMSGAHALPTVRHPVLHNMIVSGKRISHQPEFYQQNGRPYVMETINFSTPKKGPAKHHAGYVAKMFDDIRDYASTTQGIAIIHASRLELDDAIVKNSLLLLSDSADIVHWANPEERQAFLKERERLAKT